MATPAHGAHRRETPTGPDRLVTIRETCERLTLSRTTLYRLAQSGALPIVRLTPTRAAFRESDITAFVGSRIDSVGGAR